MTTGMLADYQLVHYDNNSLLVDLYQSLVLYKSVRYGAEVYKHTDITTYLT